MTTCWFWSGPVRFDETFILTESLNHGLDPNPNKLNLQNKVLIRQRAQFGFPGEPSPTSTNWTLVLKPGSVLQKSRVRTLTGVLGLVVSHRTSFWVLNPPLQILDQFWSRAEVLGHSCAEMNQNRTSSDLTASTWTSGLILQDRVLQGSGPPGSGPSGSGPPSSGPTGSSCPGSGPSGSGPVVLPVNSENLLESILLRAATQRSNV